MRKDLDENHLPEINRKNKFPHDEAESHVRIQNTLVEPTMFFLDGCPGLRVKLIQLHRFRLEGVQGQYEIMRR